jgi:hypothetical protein
MPGDLSARHRTHGDFMWRHFYNMVRLGAQGIYISMFDEYNDRNQTLSISDGSTTLVGSATYTFDPATGNTVTINTAGRSARFLRVTFTANTGWPAGQVSELEIYAP